MVQRPGGCRSITCGHERPRQTPNKDTIPPLLLCDLVRDAAQPLLRMLKGSVATSASLVGLSLLAHPVPEPLVLKIDFFEYRRHIIYHNLLQGLSSCRFQRHCPKPPRGA
jgi:hypothetical protein